MLLNVPEQIEESDEAQLIWYFGDLGTRFERSVFGALLDKVQLGGANSKTCSRCDGAGIIDGPGGFSLLVKEVPHGRTVQAETGIGAIPDETKRWESVERETKAIRRVLPNGEVRDVHGGWCPACRGTGALPQKIKGWRGSVCAECDGKKRTPKFLVMRGLPNGKSMVVQTDRPCKGCLGTGRTPQSACPTQGAQENGRAAPDDEILSKFAITSRRLSRLRARRVIWYEALQAYYGDVGAHWAVTERGRIFALYALTPSGKKLARWSVQQSIEAARIDTKTGKKKPAKTGWKNPRPIIASDPFGLVQRALDEVDPLLAEALPPATVRECEHDKPKPPKDMTPLERIGVEAALEQTKPDAHRRALLLAAGFEAEGLYFAVAKAWNTLSRWGDRARATHLATVLSLRDHALRHGKVELAEYIASHAGGL